MKIYHDYDRQHDLQQSDLRGHPWQSGKDDDSIQYYDFIKRPDLVSEVLEDFIPYANYEAIQTFYKLLKWLNGKESVLETNDCGLKFRDSQTEWMPSKREAEGRLMVFFRNHKRNLESEKVNWLGQYLWNQIELIDKDFELGYIGFAYCPTIFLKLTPPLNSQPSFILSIYFWAWGDTDEEAFENLNRVFTNLFTVFQRANKKVKTIMKA